MTDLCRLCLNQDVKLYNIFSRNEKNCTNISHYVLHLFSILIKKNDKVSTKVCQDCLEFIILCCEKRIQFRENDRIISSLYSIANKDKINDCHPSIYKLIRKQKSLKLPKTVLDKNLDVWVDLSIHNECMNSEVQDELIELDNGSQEDMCMDDLKLEQGKPRSEVTSEHLKVDVAPTNQLHCTRRNSKRPRKYGEPIFYEEYEDNPLRFIMARMNKTSRSQKISVSVEKGWPATRKTKYVTLMHT